MRLQLFESLCRIAPLDDRELSVTFFFPFVFSPTFPPLRTSTFFSIMVHYLWVLIPLSVILGASALPSSTAEQSESSSILSASVSSDALVSSNTAASSCANSASDRLCWGDFDISTNYYDFVPDTGVTREYWFNIENTTAAPDGIERIVLAVNGSIPGPTIIADWGDEVVIHVTNSMTNNGSTIHWHGIRQNFTNVSLQSPFVLARSVDCLYVLQ